MKLEEAMQIKGFEYKGTRPWYKIHDKNPNVLVLDYQYDVDGHGRSILGFNLNYLDEKLTPKEKAKLIKQIQKKDNKILSIGAVKEWLRSLFNIGDYEDLKADDFKRRYTEIIREFPLLKKIIRRYKYDGVVKFK
jgi:hypothetical protein